MISTEHHTCLIPNINILASKAGGGGAVGLGGPAEGVQMIPGEGR